MAVEIFEGELEIIPPRSGGRPTKYDPLMCELVIEFGAEGASQCEMAARLGISEDSLYEYKKKYSEFSDAIKQARALARAWWERMAREHGFGERKMNATAWIFTMKNRFPDHYKDRKEVSVSGNVTVTTTSYSELEANKSQKIKD